MKEKERCTKTTTSSSCCCHTKRNVSLLCTTPAPSLSLAGDDNVHFLNSATLVTELVEKEIQFRLMYYTNRDHSIRGGGSREHLYKMLSNFLQEEL